VFLVRSGSIEGYEKLTRRLGGNPIELLEAVGLTSAQLRNPNNYISYSKMAELMELSADRCEEPFFGLLLSQYQSSSILGDMTLSAFRQPTLQDALDNVSQYLYLHAMGVHLDQEQIGEDCLVSLTIEVPGVHELTQTMQLSTGQLANFLAELLDMTTPGFSLLLRQPEPHYDHSRLDPRVLARVHFNSRIDGIRIPMSWLEHRPHHNDDVLRTHLDQYLQSLQQRYPDNLQDQVRDIIGQCLPTGECSVERVAATLEQHPRVLQQKLQQQGCSYSDLLRKTRLEIAEQHLRHRSMSITELAFKLGYAEASIFSRSFKQWTGLSPRQWQQRHGR
jgi:AraC-like DNA-binding protein